MNINKILDIIHQLNNDDDLTISEYLDKCIKYCKENKLNPNVLNWFITFKLDMEGELLQYAKDHDFNHQNIIKFNHIIKTNNCIEVRLGSGNVKYKDVILTIYVDSDFSKGNVIIRRSFY